MINLCLASKLWRGFRSLFESLAIKRGKDKLPAWDRLSPGAGRRIAGLERTIGIRFKDRRLLYQALVHRSFAHSNKWKRIETNERLEFLGDAVLGLVVTDFLYRKYPKRREGDLTVIKSVVVSRSVLAGMARSISLGDFILLSRSEARSSAKVKNSILSDAYEALIGAIFLDRGLDVARDFITRHLLEDLDRIVTDRGNLDYKGLLQRYVQREYHRVPTYRVVGEEGPDHAKIFRVQVTAGKVVLGRGVGRTKKAAEQQSARDALVKLDRV